MELKNKKMLNKLTSAFLVIAMIFSLVIMPSVSVKAEAKTETKTEYDCPVMLMIDTSGSMQDQNKIVSTKEEAKKLFDTFKNIEVGLATFNSNGEKRIISSLTKDYEALKKQIDDLKVVGDKNKLERPLGEAIEMAKEHVASMKKYDKVVVKVMTDVTDKDGVPTSITKNATHHDDYTFMLTEPNQSIVLVIDGSGSMNEHGIVDGKPLKATKMENAKKAASSFVDAIKDKNIELGLVYFVNSRVQNAIPLTKDLDSIKSRINGINPGGSTPLGAAIKKAGDELIYNAKTTQGRIIVFGDGNSDDDAIKEATTLGKITENSKGGSLSIIVDTIGINVNENTRKQLAEIAAKGNGGYHDATDDLGEIAEGIGNNLDIIGVKITTPTTNIEPGKTLQLKVEGTKKNGKKDDITASNSGTAYKSSDENNVLVSKDGLISIPENAKENIEFTVHAKNNGHEDVFKGIISKSAKNIVKSIEVMPQSLNLKPGETQQLKVIATMGDDSKKDITKTIDGTKYTIPVENMAQIDENGLVTIPKNAEEGTINILIENQGIKQNLNLIVEKDHSNEMKSIEVTPNQAKVKTGQSQQLKVEATMGDNSKKDITSGAGTTYKSSDETMATVDDKGLVKVANNAKIGNVKIAINNGNFSDVVIITTEPIDPNRIIKIDAVPNKFTVKAGQTQQLKIMATMATGDEKEITLDGDITYRSLNENNVTVSKTGLITVNPNVKLGNTLIVVSKGDQAINVIITTEPVEEIKMTKITATPNEMTLKPGQTQKLKVIATMSDGKENDITEDAVITYKSMNQKVATVDNKGLVTIPNDAIAGTSVITITKDNMSVDVRVTAEVIDPNKLVKIEAVPNKLKVKAGQNAQLKIMATMGDKSEKEVTSDEDVTYKSLNEDAVTVSKTGLVTVNPNAKLGNTVIVVTKGNESINVVITTELDDSNKIMKIEANPNKFKLKAGETQQLKIMATLGDGKQKEITLDNNTKYKSLDENAVTVNKAGLVTVNPSVKLGNTIIEVVNGDQAINVIISTEPVEEIKMTKITATPNEMILKPGQTQKLKVIATMSDGKENDITEDAAITYKSMNQKVATVDNKGLVTIPNDAIAGTSIITITKDNMSVEVRVTAEVIDPNKLVKIEAVPNKFKVKAGETVQLKIMATMGDKSEKEVTSDDDITYKSLNENTLTVSKTGLVTVNPNAKLGNSLIEVTKGNESINVVITTEPYDPNKIMKIESNPNKFKLKAGETQQLKIMATLGDGKQKEITLDNNTTYKSLNENSVNVSKAGLVTVNPSAKLGNTIIEVVNGDQAINVIISTEPVEEIKITKITVTPKETKLKPGQTQKLKVMATMSDSSEKEITEDAGVIYISTKEKVATVDNKGLISIPNDAIAGTSIITITKDNMSVEVRITAEVIDPNKLVKIEAVPNKLKVKAGETAQLKIMGTMEDKSEKEVTSDDDITYKSLNENAVTVSKTGLVTVNPNAKLGNVLIEVTKGNQAINVVIATEPYDPNKIMKIESNPNKFKLKAGETHQLKIMATLGDGKQKEITLDNNTTYKSLNENVVTISKNGLVTVNPSAKLGNTIIEVVNGDQAINVIIGTEPVEEIRITKITVTPNETKLKPGQTQKLKVMATMSDSSEKEITEDAGVTYISTKEKVATVDNKGLVSIPNDAIAGTSIITITKDNMSVEVRVTAEVVDPNKLVKIEAVPSKLTVKAGETVQLKIMGTMGDKSEKEVTSDDDIIYRSLNEKVVTVSKTGLVTVNPNAKLGNSLIEVIKGNQGINVVIATEPDNSGKITKIESVPSKLTVKAGQTQQLKIMGTTGDGKQKEVTLDDDVTYESLNENIVTVSKTGLVKVNQNAKLGNTIIVVRKGDLAINVVIATQPVIPDKVVQLIATPNSPILTAGETQQLKITAVLDDGNTKDVTGDDKISYTSYNENMVTVSKTGLVTVNKNAKNGRVLIVVTKGDVGLNVVITTKAN